MGDLPPPLVPSEVDLRDFGFMPLDVRTLLTSSLWIKSKKDPRVAHAAVSLWCECWHQMPAASLPDDDEVLADLARCEPKEWARIRERALLHFVKCSDGRLYHEHVAKKALEAWQSKQAQRARTKAATEAREARRREQHALRDVQRNVRRNVERNVERNEQRDVSRDVHQGTGTGTGTGILDQDPDGSLSGSPPATADVLPLPSALVRPDPKAERRALKAKAAELLAYLNERAGKRFEPTETNLGFIMARMVDGATEEQCRDVICDRVAAWVSDSKMREYLRPETLFNRTKFNSYLGNLGTMPASTGNQAPNPFAGGV